MGRKRKPLIFGDEASIKRAQCSQRLPKSADITMIARVETETSPVGLQVTSIIPIDGKAFRALKRRDIMPKLGLPPATVYERDPLGFAPYTDLVYTDDEPRKFYLIQATY